MSPKVVQARTMGDAFREAGRRVQAALHAQPGRAGDVTGCGAGAGIQQRRVGQIEFGAIPATRSFDEWGEGRGVLIASWHRFKGLEADAIVIIETATRDEVRERVNRYVARSRAKHLLSVIEVEEP